MEIVRELGELHCFLQDTTDHVSDRELYDWLLTSGLHDESPEISEFPGGAWHTSPIGACSVEDTLIWLKILRQRRGSAVFSPDDPIPAHESPPFDRDRPLPKRVVC